MDIDIASGNLGTVGSYKVFFHQGKLVAQLQAAEAPFDGNLQLNIDANLVLDAIAKAVPGKIDDLLISMIKAELAK